MLVAAAPAIGQSSGDDPGDEALGYYMQGQYDSAVVCYTRELQRRNTASNNYMLARSYVRLKDDRNAQRFFEECLRQSVDDKSYFCRQCCLGLAEIHIGAGVYDSALNYLELAEARYPHRRVCNSGEFERLAELGFMFARCYFGLGQSRRAIDTMTPYMFSNVDATEKDSVEHVVMSDFYLSTLRHNFNNDTLARMVEEAVAEMHYRKERDEHHDSGEWYSVYCSIRFLGHDVVLRDGAYEAGSWGGEPVQSWSQDFISEQLKGTRTFRLLAR